MSFIDWKETYSVGIASIDEQHKKIIGLINELMENLRDGREDLIIREVLKDLADYAAYHFDLEEKIFREFRYEAKTEHFARHKDFIEKIKTLREDEAIHATGIPLDTLNYLRDWFQEHELNFDSEYGNYFRHEKLSDKIEATIQSRRD